jgi:hypothetical protein
LATTALTRKALDVVARSGGEPVGNYLSLGVGTWECMVPAEIATRGRSAVALLDLSTLRVPGGVATAVGCGTALGSSRVGIGRLADVAAEPAPVNSERRV